MILLRALNEYDMLCDPCKNGLASKMFIYNLTSNYCTLRYSDKINKLSKKDQDLFIQSYMKEYLTSHEYKLKKLYEKRHQMIKETIDGVKNQDSKSIMELFRVMSSLNNHLVNGSKSMTNWISTTKSVDAINRYYDTQTFHKVAVIKSNLKSIVDYDYVIGCDLSERKSIEDNMFLVNKINCPVDDVYYHLCETYPNIYMNYLNGFVIPTNGKFMGYNFTIASKEVAFYDYLPPSHILGTLDALGLDLAKKGLFNFEVFKMDYGKQEKAFLEFKLKVLHYLKMTKDNYLIYLFENLYMQNKNAKNVLIAPLNDTQIEIGKQKILKICKNISDIHIKR